MKRVVIERAGWKILVADGGKWDNPSTVRFAGWEDFGDRVTDLPIHGAARSLRQAGVRVHFAGGVRGLLKEEAPVDEP